MQALNTAITTFNKAIVKETITYSVGNGANANGIVLTFSESIGPNGPIDLSGAGGTVADATAVISGEADAAGTILTISSTIGAQDGETVKIPLTIGKELVTVTLEWDADKSVWTLTTDPVDVLKEVTSKLQGTLKDETGVAVSNGEIVIINVKDQSRFTVGLDENGGFPLSLDDGEYKVTAINLNNGNGEVIPMQLSFSVQGGRLIVNDVTQDTLNLQLPQPNFIGQLKNSEQNLGNSIIYLLSNYLPNSSRSLNVHTDENGNFSQRLGDGNYSITGIDTPNDYVPSYKDFEVIDGISSFDFSTFDIDAIEGNVQGVVRTDDGLLFIGGGFLDIIKTDNGDWYSASVNSAGQFGIDLPDGNYNIDFFWSYETGWIELNINFTVQDGVLVEKLDITLPAPY